MEDLLGFILEFVLDVLIQIIFGAGVDAAARAYRAREDKAHRRFRFMPFLRSTLSRANPPLTILKFTVIGLSLGFLSSMIFPHSLVRPSKFHGISLLISPLVTGLVMGLIGRAVRRRGKSPVQIESFVYGFTCAFAMSVVRILMVS